MNRLLALLAFTALVAFLGVLIAKVPEPDLIVVAGLTVCLVAYDMIRSSGS